MPLVWTDLDGRGFNRVHLRARAATVFVSTECALSSQYPGRLRRLQDAYFGRRVAFYLVDSHVPDTAARFRAWAVERNINLPLVKDVGTRLADQLGAVRTPEEVVVDRTGTTVYRGAIDDDGVESRVRKRFLCDALDSMLVGRPIRVRVAPLTAAGCLIAHPKREIAVSRGAPTYARDIAPVLNRACVACHRAGEVAPFALEGYAQAKLWAPMIADVTQRRIIPHWKAEPG